MTLESTLLQSLDKWRFPTGTRQTLTAEDAGWVATVDAECADSVGCRIWEIALKRPNAGTVDLKDRAASVASRVTGLLEPLRLLEVDTPQGVALLRSETPRQNGEELFYYEVRLGADGSANAKRYEAERNSGKRKQIAFTLTHETLAKLVGDLAI